MPKFDSLFAALFFIDKSKFEVCSTLKGQVNVIICHTYQERAKTMPSNTVKIQDATNIC